MIQKKKITIILFVFLLSLINQQIHSIEQYEYTSKTQSEYLPFDVNLIKVYDYSRDKTIYPMQNHVEVLQIGYNNIQQALLVSSHNPMKGVDESPRFVFKNYPQLSALDDNPTDFIIVDWKLYFDSILNKQLIIAVGIKENSIFLQRFDLLSDTISYPKYELYQCETNQKEMLEKSVIKIWEVYDYDYDRHDEIFVTIYSNSLRHKRLYCFDLVEQSLEWSWDNTTTAILPTNNESLPSIFLATYNSKNGINDFPFNDNYANLAIINNEGNILFNYILAVNHFGIEICNSQDSQNFFVTHEIRPAKNLNEIVLSPDSFYISKIDRNGNFIKTISMTEEPVQIRSAPLNNNENKLTMVIFRENIIRFFDNDLNLIANLSRNIQYSKYFGTIQLFDSTDFYYIFVDGLYDRNFQMVAKWPFEIYKKPMVIYIDSLNRDMHLLLETKDTWYIASIKKKSTFDLITVFYNNNQKYILMALSGLLVGLILTSIYQRRTKKNLSLITSQKLELEKTHQKLKDTQQKLIEAEKFKQAKDIAGGFAHEIRNALFPVDGSLNKLFRINKPEQYDQTKFENYFEKIKKSTNRAISMTELISQYTKLDSEYLPEQVSISKVINEVIESNQARIDEQHIEISIEDNTNQTIECNNQQLFIVLNNLLLNSLDALTNRDNCRILIKLWADKENLYLTFEDNGAGISSANIEKIFNTFFSTKPTKGTGIGLSMVKKIVEMYNGTISVSSEENRKTTFEIIFKLAAT